MERQELMQDLARKAAFMTLTASGIGIALGRPFAALHQK